MIFTPGEMSVVTLKEENIRSLTGGKLTVRIERS